MAPSACPSTTVELPQVQDWLDGRFLNALRDISRGLCTQNRVQLSHLDSLQEAPSLADLALRTQLPLSTLRRIGLSCLHATGLKPGGGRSTLPQVPPGPEGQELVSAVDQLQIPGWDVARATNLGLPLVLASVVPNCMRYADPREAFRLIPLELLAWAGSGANDPQVQVFAQELVRHCLIPAYAEQMQPFFEISARYSAVANAMELLLSQASLPEIQRCSLQRPYVDVACGFNLGAFAGGLPRTARLIGVDPHPFVASYIAKVRELLEEAPIEVQSVPLHQCRFAEASIGVLRLKHAEKFIPNLSAELPRMLSWISPEGALVIQTETNQVDRRACLAYYLPFLHDLIEAGWVVDVRYHNRARFATFLDTIVAERDMVCQLPGVAQAQHFRLDTLAREMLQSPGFEYGSPLAGRMKQS